MRPWLVLWCGLLLGGNGWAGEVHVAVAANFVTPFQAVERSFTRDTGHRVRISSGSTGKLYAQIRHGAPYDVFLAADRQRPALLEKAGIAVAGSRFTYAVGRLVLYGATEHVGAEALTRSHIKRVALANPELAPYGRAAQQVLQSLGLWQRLQPKLVRGENIAQAFQFVATGNAQVGFCALSQVRRLEMEPGRGYWPVPVRLHTPIRQDGVLLDRGADNPAAKQLFAYLAGSRARSIIDQAGYALP